MHIGPCNQTNNEHHPYFFLLFFIYKRVHFPFWKCTLDPEINTLILSPTVSTIPIFSAILLICKSAHFLFCKSAHFLFWKCALDPELMMLPWGNEAAIEILNEINAVDNEISAVENEKSNEINAVREWSCYWNIGQHQWNIEWNWRRGEWKEQWNRCRRWMKQGLYGL